MDNENIKAFLQENIELIDSNDWLQVFKNSQDPNNGLDNLDFRECLQLLKTIGIIFTKDQLLDLFIKVMKDEIIQYFQYEPNESEDLYWFLNHVPNNFCGYYAEEAQEIFKNYPDQLGIIIEYPRQNMTLFAEITMKLKR